ncbi:efflux RND transporter permease subunit [Aliikangiella maris]|uniref:MMPL family transporter n=2 Tax=Aliikangiella maris TaxID=3162458 RepID=A0ABV3MKT8_9GAMM
MSNQLILLSLNRPKLIYVALLVITLVSGLLMLNIQVDTDPENMLPQSEPARIFHNDVKKEFLLSDMLVVGIKVNQSESIFNQQSLADVKLLTDFILTLQGVKQIDVNSLSVIDNISQKEPGSIRFEWMMPEKPQSTEDVTRIESAVERLPFVIDSLVSGDKKAATIYVPVLDKNQSYQIANQIRDYIAQLSKSNTYYITGLPVAEDTFGVEMFVQMGISAPLAALVIYLLMLYFFRSPTLVAAPMIIAMSTVIIIMGLMIGAGFTVHIMSSMIPIFLMPIAVVDSVHIMSEFADNFRPGTERRGVIKQVVAHLFKPMLFTSVTSAVGFYSLILTPIPPVQIFGFFVGSGILLAFLLTILFIPAYVISINENRLYKMQQKLHEIQSLSQRTGQDDSENTLLQKVGRFSQLHKKLIIFGASLMVLFSVVGIQQIIINDNPVRWFKADHEIRVADSVLNQHFAGTYDAHLVFQLKNQSELISAWQKESTILVNNIGLSASQTSRLNQKITESTSTQDIVAASILLDDLLFDAESFSQEAADAMTALSEQTIASLNVFLQPEVLHYIERLQQHIVEMDKIGKSNSVVDLVKTVNRDLVSGQQKDYRIPDSANGVSQTLLQFQSSHRPQDLWHFVTPDYTKALVWIQMTSGDNQDMSLVIQQIEQYIQQHPLPQNISFQWAGKAYLNLVWQEKMVAGMMESLLSAFVIVFIMMAVLFRSVLWGLLAMLPLTITILLMYGIIGWSGKYYDMPIAVLSALTLGLSVDFAIHFIERFRATLKQQQDWQKTIVKMYQEPANAISRNALVIALGFTPLLLAPLVPYITVGAFLAAIMLISALVTIVVLPACMLMLKRFLQN